MLCVIKHVIQKTIHVEKRNSLSTYSFFLRSRLACRHPSSILPDQIHARPHFGRSHIHGAEIFSPCHHREYQIAFLNILYSSLSTPNASPVFLRPTVRANAEYGWVTRLSKWQNQRSSFFRPGDLTRVNLPSGHQ